MVLERTCHAIEDPEIAWLFEQEVARGGGSRFVNTDVNDNGGIPYSEEAECLDTVDLLLHLQDTQGD